MKRILSLLLTCCVFGAFAQVDSSDMDNMQSLAVPADTAWKIGGNFGLQFTQAAYENWQAGGVNSLAGNSLTSIFANYDNGGKWTWSNKLDLAYGLNYQDTIFNKTDDRIELTSRVDRSIGKNWSASGLVNFRTQFANGYSAPGERGDSVRISGFMAPGYLLTAIGFTYKPNKKFNLFLSPLTSKMTFVMDQRLADAGAFGVTAADTVNGVYVPGEQFRQEVGGYLNLTYKTPLVTNVDLQYSLGLFSNYLDGQYKFIDVNTELLLFMKVNDYITANLSLNLIYDNDILFDVNDDGTPDGPRTQLKEVIGVGFAYNFGAQAKK
jgi:hypothetical protein